MKCYHCYSKALKCVERHEPNFCHRKYSCRHCLGSFKVPIDCEECLISPPKIEIKCHLCYSKTLDCVERHEPDFCHRKYSCRRCLASFKLPIDCEKCLTSLPTGSPKPRSLTMEPHRVTYRIPKGSTL
jgi:hypothetical protein